MLLQWPHQGAKNLTKVNPSLMLVSKLLLLRTWTPFSIGAFSVGLSWSSRKFFMLINRKYIVFFKLLRTWTPLSEFVVDSSVGVSCSLRKFVMLKVKNIMCFQTFTVDCFFSHLLKSLGASYSFSCFPSLKRSTVGYPLMPRRWHKALDSSQSTEPTLNEPSEYI